MQSSDPPEPWPSWRELDGADLGFRFMQDPVFNLLESEEEVLARMRAGGLTFCLLPRFDPTTFLHVKVATDPGSYRLDMAVDEGGRYVSFIMRRGPGAEAVFERLCAVFGESSLDRARSVETRAYSWHSFFVDAGAGKGGSRRARTRVFNFDPLEQALLERLEQAVLDLNPASPQPLEFHIYPRGTTFGGIELMLTDGRNSQLARVFVRNHRPPVYRWVTEATALGERSLTYIRYAMGQQLSESHRQVGRFLSVVYGE